MSAKTVRRCFVLLFAALLLTGCSRFFEGSYTSITRHEEGSMLVHSDEPYFEVRTYVGMKNALQALINAGAETGSIHAVEYEGSVQDDIARVCLEATKDYPLGAYAVEFIGQSVSQILGYYEISIHISYRLTPEEIKRIGSVSSLSDLYAVTGAAILRGQEHLAVQVSTLSATEDALLKYVKNYYRSHPELLSAEPEVEVTFFPSEDNVIKIVDMEFLYQRTGVEEAAALDELIHSARELLPEADLSPEEAAMLCCRSLSQNVTAPGRGNTAYDAIVLGSAGSEGCAMAYQLLCNLADIECQVVEGRRSGSVYYWNMIHLEDSWYHVDSFACIGEAVTIGYLRTDSDLLAQYWWDVDKYPVCDGSMSIMQVIEKYLQHQQNVVELGQGETEGIA